MEYVTQFGIGDKVVLTMPHQIKTRKASFPDWEDVVTDCPGNHTVTINAIWIRAKETTYIFGSNTPCECGRKDVGNCFCENDRRVSVK